jgi:branched-chain amino acid transport system substrate-binding protein
VKTAGAEINAAGGILGRKVVFVSADDAGDAIDAVPAFRKMISVDKPAAIIGPFSMTGPAVMPLIRQNHVPTFQIGGTTQLDHTRVNYFWRANASDDQEGTADAYWAIHQHYMTAAFAYTTDASAATLEGPTRHAYTAHGGKIVMTANLAPDASSYRSDILRIMATPRRWSSSSKIHRPRVPSSTRLRSSALIGKRTGSEPMWSSRPTSSKH